MHFIRLTPDHFLNLSTVSEFKIITRGERRGPQAGRGWEVQITVGSTTHHLHDAEAFDAYRQFDEATRDPETPPNW